jgi:anhydro-N-acetylmuramic acid kinase
MAYYVGIMSGTSLDGVDIAIVDIEHDADCSVISAATFDFPSSLHMLLQRLVNDGHCHLKNFGALDVALGQFIGHAINTQLSQCEIQHNDIVAIGSHGHTVYHSPEGELPFSLQIGNANVIAEITQITTVADFRQRDIAALGQGAPLVPAFHHALFSTPEQTNVILNIGGIANVTVLNAEQAVIGFDTGPGNGLMDAWIQQHLGQAYDQHGNWAASGQSNDALLIQMLSDPYFSQAIPKSTGREYFNLAWLEKQLNQFDEVLDAVDVQATLNALTTISIVSSLERYNPQAIYVCGGGVHNRQLMRSLQSQLENVAVSNTAELGINPDWVEAAAFAWLAYRTINRKTGNLPSVTGAKHAVILGAIYSV